MITEDPTGQRWRIDASGNRKNALYNAVGKVEDAVLLPTSRRTQCVPRSKNGMGQANVRYVYDDHGILALTPWMKDVIGYVESYNGENLLVDSLADVPKIIENEIEKAAGFESNPKIRRVIEDHAMQLVERDYSRRGYAVKDKHATESYDLLCEKDGLQILVEVKGTRSNGRVIILTEKEVKLAADPNSRTDLCVVHSISLSGEKAAGGSLERYENWNPEAHDLRSISHQCRLTKKLATPA